MSDKHRVLVIGTGSIGERHLRCFLATGRCAMALCELNESLRAEVMERYDIAQVFSNLDAALAAPFDAAVIATPAPAHIPIARQLAENGVHLLIEKPLSTSFEGVDELIEAVKARSLTAATAYVWRAHPVVKAMKEALEAGSFGRPVELLVVAGQHFPTYRPAYREIYYAKREQGGGAIQDALTHMLNLGEWLVGPIDRLVADAAHQVLEGVTVEDTAHMLARHGDVMASYTLNQHQPPNETSITIVGQSGLCRALTHENRLQWMTEPAGQWHERSFAPLERDELFIRQANAFLDAIQGKGAPLCTLEEGAQTLRVNLAALRSADDAGKFIRVGKVP